MKIKKTINGKGVSWFRLFGLIDFKRTFGLN
jgi:hypothetical protein